MMEIEFVGVGEAFDETLPNNSQILEWNGTRMLIDCGYSVPPVLWKRHPGPDHLDAIYISHRHADHYFGLPSYLTRLAEDGRRRDIDIVCAEGMKRTILEMIDYGYQGIVPKLGFAVVFHEVNASHPFEFRGARLEFAPSTHPVLNYSIAVSEGGKKYAYSGDGNFNRHTSRLYSGCDLLVHETYSFDEEVPGHARIIDVVKMAREQGVKKLALTHLQRDVRRNRINEIREWIHQAEIPVILPEAGERMEV